MDYLRPIDFKDHAQLKEDIRAWYYRAQFEQLFIVTLQHIVKKWGDRIMNARMLNVLVSPEVKQWCENNAGALSRAELEYHYISGDRHKVSSLREDSPVEYIISCNFRFMGDKWAKTGRRRESAPGDYNVTLRFPDLRYSEAAFLASTERELAGAHERLRTLHALIEDENRLTRLVNEYNVALKQLKLVCENDDAKCVPLYSFFRSGQV
jgi:hypothetical protein